MNLSKFILTSLCAAVAPLLFCSAMSAQVVTLGSIDFIQHPASEDLTGKISTDGGMSVTWSGSTSFDTLNSDVVTTGSSGTIFGAFDSTTRATLNSYDVVWVSMTLRTSNTEGTNRFGLYYDSASINNSVTAGQRVAGLQFRIGPFVDYEEITSGATSNKKEIFSSTGWNATTYYTVAAKISVDRTASASDTVQFYYVPGVDAFDFNNPGSPYATLIGTDFIGPTTEILGVVLDGNQPNVNYSFLNVAAVPEPSTYAVLFGLGALGFAAWRRRRAA